MLRTAEVPYVYSRDGIYYFTRRIPKDLESHYRCPRIVLSLRTKSLRAAKTKSTTLAAQLDEEWMPLRWRSNDSPLRRYLSDQAFEARESSNAPLMTEARDIYLRSKGDGRPATFSQAVDRAIGNLVDTVGNKPIDTYSRQDANCVRDALFERGLSKAGRFYAATVVYFCSGQWCFFTPALTVDLLAQGGKYADMWVRQQAAAEAQRRLVAVSEVI